MSSCRQKIVRAIAAVCVLLLLVSCGGGGGGSAGAGGGGGSSAPQTFVAGTVLAPGGQVALFYQPTPLERFAAHFASIAHAAITGLSPVPDGTAVQLGRMSSTGVVTFLANTTISGGQYSFNITSLGLTFSSDLVVQVINTGTGVRMRAFVTGANVDVSPVSESAIQAVLDRIAAAPGTTLANFTLQEIKDVVNAIDALTSTSNISAGMNINSTVTSVKNAMTGDSRITDFLVSASAPGQTTDGPGDIGNYLPLTQGTSWTYQGTEQITGQAPQFYSNTATINGTHSVGGVTTTILQETNQLNSGAPSQEYFVKDSRGITVYGNNDPADTLTPQLTPYLNIRFPIAAGSSFEEINKTGLNFGEDLDGDSVNERLDVVSVVSVKGFESVTVPAGTFANSAKIETVTTYTVTLSTNNQVIPVQTIQTYWLAPGVGPVKQVLQSPGLTVTESLGSTTQGTQSINLPGNSDLIYDATSQKIYASVRGNPGAVIPIDPVTGNMGAGIATGIDPAKLARSDNGQYLYVGLEGQAAVQRINLASSVVDLTIPLGSDGFFGPIYAEDIEVLPGNPQAVAITRRINASPRHWGVAIYDNDVQRATTTPTHTGSNVIEFSASAGTLYGYNNETTEFGFRRMSVDASGVTTLDTFDSFMGDLISGFNVDIRFHGGLIYTSSGRVIDPVTRTIVGTFTLPSGASQVLPDSSTGRVFFLSFTSGPTIYAFDINTRALLATQVITASGTPRSLIRWGNKGLAFRTTDGQIYIIESTTLIP